MPLLKRLKYNIHVPVCHVNIGKAYQLVYVKLSEGEALNDWTSTFHTPGLETSLFELFSENERKLGCHIISCRQKP